MSRAEASKFLRTRYALQCERSPRLREQVKLQTYLSRNLHAAMKLDGDAAKRLTRPN
jgi:hypothetical protein